MLGDCEQDYTYRWFGLILLRSWYVALLIHKRKIIYSLKNHV
jgi:hypothetical protein